MIINKVINNTYANISIKSPPFLVRLRSGCDKIHIIKIKIFTTLSTHIFLSKEGITVRWFSPFRFQLPLYDFHIVIKLYHIFIKN